MMTKDYREKSLTALREKVPETLDRVTARMIRQSLVTLLFTLEMYRKSKNSDEPLVALETLLDEIEVTAEEIEDVLNTLLHNPGDDSS